MSDLRARPLDVIMSESMPFMQRWHCRTTWPLTDILNDQYFLNLRNVLHSGDTIRICRFDRNDSNDRKAKMLETCEVAVLSSGPAEVAVPLAVISEVLIMGDGEVDAYSVRRGQAGKFKLMKGEEVIQEFGSKAECEAALKQKMAA